MSVPLSEKADLSNLLWNSSRNARGMDDPESIMFLSIYMETIKNYAELSRELEKEKNKESAMPARCKMCDQFTYCDRDYCLCWYH